MAGQRQGDFRELISPFLNDRLQDAADRYGVRSPEYQAISRQYVRVGAESMIQETDRRRHYEAEMFGEEKGSNLKGVERLYRRTVLLEPTTACAAHCRWCLRGQYDSFSLRNADVDAAVSHFAEDEELREVLITGGDPLMAVRTLSYALDAIAERAPRIEVVRIGTRVPFQAPGRIKGRLLAALQKPRPFRLEVGVHICHPVEFWPESVRALQALMDANVRVYNQHPLLKGVNDDRDTLVRLYDEMRRIGIEAHYLFHAIPMRGMAHHRTTVQRGLDLITELTSGGEFSGRAKPHYCAMTDIGKVVLYHGTIVRRDEDANAVLLKSGYRVADRQRFNPSWRVPSSVEVDRDGYMNVWYPDGADDADPEDLVVLDEHRETATPC